MYTFPTISVHLDRLTPKISESQYLNESWRRHQMETFSALLAICAGNSPVPVNSPHKGQWRGALMFSLICAWINDWVNKREAGDLRRRRGHYDVNVMDDLVYWYINASLGLNDSAKHGWRVTTPGCLVNAKKSVWPVWIIKILHTGKATPQYQSTSYLGRSEQT